MDLQPEMRNLLMRNGLQAHVAFDGGGYRLIVQGHDSPLLVYPITERKMLALTDWGTNTANKKAYNIPVSYTHLDVYKRQLKDGYKDRNKYIVIIGFTPEGVAIGALLINSEIDSSKRSEELLNCQYPLMVRNYRDILDYDSWLDCSDIFELSKLKITEKNGKLKGCLISEDRERVIQFLRETEVFDNATKRRYGIIK